MTFPRVTHRGLAAAGLILANAVLARPAAAQQVFEPTSGTHAWNDNANWGPSPPQPFPNGVGAAAAIQGPTGALTVQLGQPITLGSLTINKSLMATFNTTIAGSAANRLTFDGGGTIATTASFTEGGGVSIISAPITTTGPLTITQGDDGVLRFTGAISGAGDVLVNRDTNGDEFVAFNAANTYTGTTTISGNAGTAYVVLRLNNANSIPGGVGATGGTSNITLTNSAILGLDNADFKRGIGTGPDQIQFVAPLNSGFASFNGTRIVNIGGASAALDWDAAGFGQLTLGAPTATGTVEFQNPLNFGDAANRNIRVVAGTGGAASDAVLTGGITSTGTGNNFTKVGGGVLSLQAANTYTGNTIINGGVLRIDHLEALPVGTNISIGGTGTLGLGVGDLVANLGTGPGEVQFATGNGGFTANGGHRKVTLNGGATLNWGEGNFIGNNNFILSWAGSSGLIEITNPINLNGGARTLAGRDGTLAIDSRLSGVISGDGSILKTQPGTLDLAAANTYTGITTTQGGVLLLTNANSIPGGINGGSLANITLNGGVLGLGHGDLTASLGSGAGQVQWNPDINAGFAAFGGHRVVNLGGAGAQVVWGEGGFATNNLILNWESADGLIEFANAIDLNGGARNFAGRDGSADVDSRVSGVISGSGSVVKIQPGTTEFTAANTYDGGTVINVGRLLANNTTGSAVGTGDVAVTNDGTLGGTGFVGAAGDASHVVVNADGHINPGTDAGKLTVFGDVSWETGSFFDVDVAGNAPGVDVDQLVVNGLATLAGTLHINLTEGFTPSGGLTLPVLTATGGVAGTFTNLTWTGETTWEAIYDANTVSIVAASSVGFAADFDADGDVDADDLVAWRGGFGTTTGATRAGGDADGDGDVDGNDFLTWQSQLGSGLTPGVSAVPEPSSLVLAALAALHIGQRASRRARGDSSKRLRRDGAVHPGRALHGAVAPKLAWLGNRA